MANFSNFSRSSSGSIVTGTWTLGRDNILASCYCVQAEALSVAPSNTSAASLGSASSADGIGTFHVGGRREAPLATLLAQVRPFLAMA
jgi:hypothetical protein